MFKKYTYPYVVLILSVFMAGCATAPKLTQDEILAKYPELAKLDKGLRDAAAQGVPDLAPRGYAAAKAKLDDALAEAGANRVDTTNAATGEGLRLLEKANSDAAVSRDLLREVLEARDKAFRAGAKTTFPERAKDLDRELREAAGMVERNRLEDAKERRQKLIAGYEQLQLASLKEGMVDVAKAALDDARNKDAKKFAPKTFKLAEEELGLALSVLDADRTRTDKANVHAKRAKYLAEQSSAITELIKDFERRDYTREDSVLWYQKQLTEIGAPLGKELPFNQSNRSVVLGMQQAISDLVKQRDDTAAERHQYEQQLSLTTEERSAVNKVQSMFTEEQATVYEQRKNILISAHGFRFPPGGSELETQNFSLMNKIVQAINVYPESQINVSGHTDSTGSATINQALSEKRAANVAKFLTEVGGIAASRISYNGYGKEKPVASNETAAGRALNRRVEILIINQ